MRIYLYLDRKLLFTYGLPLAVISLAVYLSLAGYANEYPELAIGITYDLMLTAPLLFYILIRKTKIPKITVVLFLVIGFMLATLLVPPHQQFHLHLITAYLLPAIELVFLFYNFYHICRIIKAFKNNPDRSRDFYFIIRESVIKTMGNVWVAKIFATEIAMVYYAVGTWERAERPVGSFTGFRENGITALLGVIIFMITFETAIVHLLVSRWSETTAWILTVLSMYLVIQIFAHLRALKKRFIKISDHELLLKYGLFGDMKIYLKDILCVESTSNEVYVAGLKVAKLAILGDLESHNVAIHFKKKQQLEKPYGFTVSCDIVLLHVDQRLEFVGQLNDLITVD